MISLLQKLFTYSLLGILLLFQNSVFGDSSGDEDDDGEISVPRSPRIEGESLVKLKYRLGDKLEDLTCYIQGSPTPTVGWFKNGKRVFDQDFDTEFNAKDGKAELDFEQETLISANQVGNFTCFAANFLGRAVKTFMISIDLGHVNETKTETTTNKIEVLDSFV